MDYKRILIRTGILIVICAFFLLPLKIPYTINAPGKILPAKEWLVIKGSDGRLMTILKDNLRGVSNNYSVSQFERGDAVQFSLCANIASGKSVSVYDTVAMLYSNEIEQQFIQLKGELEVAKASLVMNLAGEKSSVIKEEKAQLEYDRRKAEEQKKIFNRIDSLFRKDLVSQEEYDISKSKSDLYDINVSIAEAHLQSITTGVKQEEISYLNSKITSLQSQLNVLQKRFKNYILISQVNGIVNQTFSSDTLLIISDTTNYVVLSPINWEERNYLTINQEVLIKSPESSLMQGATIIRRDNLIHPLNGRQFFLITSKVNSKTPGILPGLMVQCSVQCQPINLVEYIKRIFKSILG